MQSGLINKVAVTPANVPDAAGLKNVCPEQGANYLIKDIVLNPRKKLRLKKLPFSGD